MCSDNRNIRGKLIMIAVSAILFVCAFDVNRPLYSKTEVGCTIVGSLETNCYFLYDDTTKKALIIDPGSNGEKLAELTLWKELQVCAVLITHGHDDHTSGLPEFLEKIDCPVYAPSKDSSLLESNGIRGFRTFKNDETLEIADFRIKVIEVPSHTKGASAFFLQSNDTSASKLFSGDILFADAIGKTWEPGDDIRELDGIRERLLVLPDSTVVYPGHGKPSTIREIKVWIAKW
ncbi:MAG: MBL fold metallo-hydrolase [Candidatus Riflebacteria bacterium]|nr:MBL fold metallo-hydrolase [Candidatus Riflebacteria bacterium]